LDQNRKFVILRWPKLLLSLCFIEEMKNSTYYTPHRTPLFLLRHIIIREIIFMQLFCYNFLSRTHMILLSSFFFSIVFDQYKKIKTMLSLKLSLNKYTNIIALILIAFPFYQNECTYIVISFEGYLLLRCYLLCTYFHFPFDWPKKSKWYYWS